MFVGNAKLFEGFSIVLDSYAVMHFFASLRFIPYFTILLCLICLLKLAGYDLQ